MMMLDIVLSGEMLCQSIGRRPSSVTFCWTKETLGYDGAWRGGCRVLSHLTESQGKILVPAR